MDHAGHGCTHGMSYINAPRRDALDRKLKVQRSARVLSIRTDGM
jgi:hypothetical protein